MHKAVCSECGQKCEVPFKPFGDKPVYCNDCFGGNPDSPGRGGRENRRESRGRSNYEEKRMYETVCEKCGNTCEVPFRPTGGKPVYCSDCFQKGDNGGGKKNAQMDEKFEILNIKLDRIMKMLASFTTEKESAKKTATKKAPAAKKKTVRKK